MKFQKNKFTGVILAGGKNSRFGAEKALAELNGIKNIERIIAAMDEVFEENIIIANNQDHYKEFKLKIFPDLQEGKGPLMGIYTALQHASTNVFVIACDMPLVDSNTIRKIAGSLETYDAVIPKFDGKMHFLHAAYSLRSVHLFKKKLDKGSFRLGGIVEDLNCNVVEEFDFGEGTLTPFFNMNTPEDFALVKKCF